jgi:hypothetical protein
MAVDTLVRARRELSIAFLVRRRCRWQHEIVFQIRADAVSQRKNSMKSEEPYNRIVPRWSVLIAVRIDGGNSELIHGPEEALFLIEHHWPIKTAPMKDAALRRCIAAKNYELPCEIAKQAFVAAAIEASVLD